MTGNRIGSWLREARPLSPGQIVRVRSRQYLVEGVVPPAGNGDATLVRLSCLEDDAQGDPLEVLWEKEIGGMMSLMSDVAKLASDFEAQMAGDLGLKSEPEGEGDPTDSLPSRSRASSATPR